jgi:LPXTG-motif cell wall-anchored protein
MPYQNSLDPVQWLAFVVAGLLLLCGLYFRRRRNVFFLAAIAVVAFAVMGSAFVHTK